MKFSARHAPFTSWNARQMRPDTVVQKPHVALVMILALVVLLAPVTPTLSKDIEVRPMGNWLEHRQATFQGNPLIVHLRTGYERAVLFPEAVRLSDPDSTLPDCDLVLDEELLGFYPKRSFKREALKLTGIKSGTEYILLVQASPNGLRQPLQINR